MGHHKTDRSNCKLRQSESELTITSGAIEPVSGGTSSHTGVPTEIRSVAKMVAGHTVGGVGSAGQTLGIALYG